MKVLQGKLASLGRTEDKLDAEIEMLDEQVAAWRAADEAARPKAKRAQALKVVDAASIPQPTPTGAGSSQTVTQSAAKSGPAK